MGSSRCSSWPGSSARDVRIGRANDFLLGQLYICNSVGAILLWLAGLRFFWLQPEGRRYRGLGWLFVTVFLLFLVARAREYYLAPAYPLLIAGGAVSIEKGWADLEGRRLAIRRAALYAVLTVAGLASMAVTLPLAPVNSPWWHVASKANVELPRADRLAGARTDSVRHLSRTSGCREDRNGHPGHKLRRGRRHRPLRPGQRPAPGHQRHQFLVASRLRGSLRPPRTLIVIGMSLDQAERNFTGCALAGHNTNRYGVGNEESLTHPDIFLCGAPRPHPGPSFGAPFTISGEPGTYHTDRYPPVALCDEEIVSVVVDPPVA